MRDTSEWAATPALGYAARMISLCVLIFLAMIAFVFWIGGMVEKPAAIAASTAPEPVPPPSPAVIT
jgi:hypothetical protein